MAGPVNDESRAVGFLRLAQFLQGGRLNQVVGELEYALASANDEQVESLTPAAGLGGIEGQSLFEAAVQTRPATGPAKRPRTCGRHRSGTPADP